MFQGSPHITLDAKGRLAVPVRFRADLLEACDGKVTFTRHPDGCALLYPRPVWEEKKRQLLALPYAARGFQRLVMGSACDAELDANGRVLVPPEIRQACALSREIVLVGMGEHFELWDAQHLAAAEAAALEEDISAVAAEFNF